VDHLRQLRALQDETHGFTALIPLAYQPEDNDIPVAHPPTGFDSLRTIAVSRIYLDNFPHITAYWVGLGLKLAQVALSYGADDIHGTIIEEHIFPHGRRDLAAIADRGGNDQSHPRSRPHAGAAEYFLRADKNFGKFFVR
jgi:2-iminoacetate synthase ThiH